MKLALIAYACLTLAALIGFTVGYALSAALNAGRTNDRDTYARGWTLGYHAGKQAREE